MRKFTLFKDTEDKSTGRFPIPHGRRGHFKFKVAIRICIDSFETRTTAFGKPNVAKRRFMTSRGSSCSGSVECAVGNRDGSKFEAICTAFAAAAEYRVRQ